MLKNFLVARPLRPPHSVFSVGFTISYFIGNSVLFKFIDEEAKLIAGRFVMYVVGHPISRMVIALRAPRMSSTSSFPT